MRWLLVIVLLLLLLRRGRCGPTSAPVWIRAIAGTCVHGDVRVDGDWTR